MDIPHTSRARAVIGCGEQRRQRSRYRGGGRDLTRSAVTILNDLEHAGYLEREKRGRRNHYVLHPDRPLRHPANAAHTVDDLIRALLDIG